jgi:hypothetical protein
MGMECLLLAGVLTPPTLAQVDVRVKDSILGGRAER